jgi:purine-binding chemotaxis protein CheW
VDILTFQLDRHAYAFPAHRVVQVVQMVAISPLPGAPPVIEGVVNVRGMVVPVFDLRQRLGLPPQPIDPSQHLVILAAGPRTAAVRVDSAEEFQSIPDSDITRSSTLADSGISSAGSRHVAGIAVTPDGTTIIYDLVAFLSLSESGTLDEVMATSGE